MISSRTLGARYHAGDAAEIDVDVDVVIECTGLGAVGKSAASRLVSGGIMCLTGIMNLDPTLDVDATALNRNMVLRNQVLFGTVNAGRRHWEQAAAALAAADPWMAERPDHPPRTPRSLDRGARPTARRHQGRGGPHGMTAPEVTAWSGTPGLLSEGPRWHEERQELLWVDILGRQMHRGTLAADGALERVETISIDRHIGAVAPAIGGGYVLAAGPGFLFVDDAGSIHELAQPEAGRTDVRMNDGACDPQGRFWAGTMAYDESPGAGSLYRLELDGTLHNRAHRSDDLKRHRLEPRWQHDVPQRQRHRLRRRVSTSTARPVRSANAAHSCSIDQPGVAPDGLTVDEDGGIWVALWGGAAVNRYAPDGSLLATVPVPVERPTSCAFGGPDRATLFVTTARADLDEAALARQPDAGRVFAIDGLGVRGLPCEQYRGRTR